jgi:hypothetical protein
MIPSLQMFVLTAMMDKKIWRKTRDLPTNITSTSMSVFFIASICDNLLRAEKLSATIIFRGLQGERMKEKAL